MKVLAVIPARGGSKGIPGKNIRPFCGLPLIAHTIAYAKLCPEITRCIVSTDSESIAAVARQYGAEVPFLRPAQLAQDDTPMWPVLRHALESAEAQAGAAYDALILLDPTSPARVPEDVSTALGRLESAIDADGIIAVSRPDFSPIWHCVVDEGGWMADFSKDATRYERRQDVPPVYRITGALYIWRTGFLRREANSWRRAGRHLMHEIPDLRAMSIDTEEEFRRAQVLVESGLIHFPWMAADANLR